MAAGMGQFFYGVIEGFYGRQWSWPVREGYAGFLKQHGFDCYIYAPKGEAALRTQWRLPFESRWMGHITSLATVYHGHGLRWGLGLSPLGLSEQFSSQDKRLLLDKIDAINGLQPDILCILFDDMRGDLPDLAKRQLEVIHTIIERSAASQHIICSTYYSFDPVLEKVFGSRPPDYWAALNDGLPTEAGLCWTGSQVISAEITKQDISEAASALGRAPLIWDNYPVNDGKKTASHLHLRPYSGRSSEIRQLTTGYLVNPMNQAHLSKLVLQSLPAMFQPGYSEDSAWERGLALLDDEGLAAKIASHAELFQVEGLESLSAQKRSELVSLYAGYEHPAAREIVEWLNGEYQFDPACLTD